ncbi:transposase [Thiolapillus sp.]|uniref:transposase n=1 Tax=Thiolapillus sp. TaxID=2017437 RepID=UPI0025F5EDFF
MREIRTSGSVRVKASNGRSTRLATLENHAERVVRRWTSTYTNARMEGLNSLFQAARARARGYRNNRTFMTMIYMIASPAGSILKST